MTDNRDFIDQLVDPQPFIPASVLAELTPEGRRRLFRSLYEKKQSDDEYERAAAKVAMNSTYGQTAPDGRSRNVETHSAFGTLPWHDDSI